MTHQTNLSTPNTATPVQSSEYFDLHTRGLGYVNRIREVSVKGKKGQTFWACSIAALRGKKDEADYTYIDTRVSGDEAIKLIRRCLEAVNAQKKVLISFTIGDIYAETFTYGQGEKKGETGCGIKGRLLHISHIKVDGKQVYPKVDSTSIASPSSDESQATTSCNPTVAENDQVAHEVKTPEDEPAFA